MTITAPDLRGQRVFLVEDESLIIMMIEDALADLGCEIVGVASRFDDALAKASALTFDIALLDVNLNGFRTFPIAETIRERGIPFVFATGYGAGSVPTQLKSAPVLQKPFASNDLAEALSTALRTR